MMNTSLNKITVESTISSSELQSILQQFTGTECWYKHGIVKDMLYTDGVQYFAKNAGEQGAYWFLDTVAWFIYPLLEQEPFLVINLIINSQNKGVVQVDDGNGKELLCKPVPFTDVQAGKWKFYLTDNVMLLPSEY